MRQAFIDTLFDLAYNDKRIMLLVADVGYGVVDQFAKAFPDQFVNVGVSEQNMVGLAAGLAKSGKVVFTYSIAGFQVYRALEQIRNDICFPMANVKVVSSGCGLSYGTLGYSHHACEDIAVMRAMPNMYVIAPNDNAEAKWTARMAVDRQGPCYIRLGKLDATLHRQDIDFHFGKAIRMYDGGDLTLIATGGTLLATLSAADLLASKRSLRSTVLSMHTVKPLDARAVFSASRYNSSIFTIEEHSVIGGLGSAVAEVLMECDHRPAIFRRIGLKDEFEMGIGSHEYLMGESGLDASGIAKRIETELHCSG